MIFPLYPQYIHPRMFTLEDSSAELVLNWTQLIFQASMGFEALAAERCNFEVGKIWKIRRNCRNKSEIVINIINQLPELENMSRNDLTIVGNIWKIRI